MRARSNHTSAAESANIPKVAAAFAIHALILPELGATLMRRQTYPLFSSHDQGQQKSEEAKLSAVQLRRTLPVSSLVPSSKDVDSSQCCIYIIL
jgi:hypothetical protein